MCFAPFLNALRPLDPNLKYRPNFALRPTFFGKNATKFFIEIFSVFFFVDCKVWNLSFQTHSDSSKNIKNSLFYAILKIFCHPWLWPKKSHFGQKPLLLGVNRPEKSFLRCSFKTAGTREFSIFFAQNFKSDTSNTMFEIWRGTNHSKWGWVLLPATPKLSSILQITENRSN